MNGSSLIGSRLGKYQIQAEIGRGGMGVVYLGYDPQLGRQVAIKVLAPHLAWEKEFIERFLREARAAARLKHPNIVTIHDVGQKGGLYYYVMEYLEGQALTGVVRQRGPLSPRETLAILRPLASALDHAHHSGLVHRDIKPANIIVNPAGHVTLTDFGIARAAQETRLTSTGAIVGTPEYMSPEQAKGLTVDARSDQYSLAVVAYEMLSGQVPFQADSTLALLHKVAYDPPPPICQTRPDLPMEVEKVLAKALAKKPGDRYPSVSAFVEALEHALAGKTLPAGAPTMVKAREAAPPPRPPTPPPPPRPATPPPPPQRMPEPVAAPAARPVPPRSRVPTWVWAVGGAITLVVLLGGVMLLIGGLLALRDRESPPALPTQVAVMATSEPLASATATSAATEPARAVPALAPSPTATPVLPPTATPVPPPTATPVLPPTATPVPPPTATPVPPPTATPTWTPTSPPPPTPTPTPCTVAVYGAFSGLWHANASRLGCPLSAAKTNIWIAEEDFQGGRMLWREDNTKIYVLYSSGRWEKYNDIWHEGEAEFTCGTPSSPPTPKRGFGKIWCTYNNVRQGLGEATNAEWGKHGTVQEFGGGLIVQTGSGPVYVFYNDDSTWKQ